MAFYAPQNKEDLNKLKKTHQPKKRYQKTKIE